MRQAVARYVFSIAKGGCSTPFYFLTTYCCKHLEGIRCQIGGEEFSHRITLQMHIVGGKWLVAGFERYTLAPGTAAG